MKDKFLHDFENMCRDIRNTMDSLLTNGSITNDEYYEMLNITGTLEEYIYNSIEDIGSSALLVDRFTGNPRHT